MIDSIEVARFVIGGAGPLDAADVARWLRALSIHRVEALADARRSDDVALPRSLVAALHDARRRAAARELAQRDELRRLADAASRAGLSPIAIKGTALAYSAYPDPSLRPRIDTDLLIEEDRVGASSDLLTALGYVEPLEPDLTLASFQRHFERPHPRDAGFVHRCDLHWKLSNAQAFADALPPADIRRTAVVLDGFAPLVRPSASMSLLIACIHRAAHHFAADTLIWMYDIHLLASSLDEAAWSELIELAQSRGVAPVLADGVLASRRLFQTAIADSVVATLGADRAQRSGVSGFLRADRRLVDVLHDDLRALPTWRTRVRLLREHLFPPPAYMRARYGIRARAALPALYAYRVIRGAPAWFRRARGSVA